MSSDSTAYSPSCYVSFGILEGRENKECKEVNPTTQNPHLIPLPAKNDNQLKQLHGIY